VLVTEIARAMNRLSKSVIPIIWPTANPSPKVPNASENAIIRAFLPTERSLAIGYSRPTTNRSKTIPISASKFRISGWSMKLKGGV
jgi:hypothetical protein